VINTTDWKKTETWIGKWDTEKDKIDDLRKGIESPDDIPRAKVIKDLIDSLECFAYQQVDYFCNGFTGTSLNGEKGQELFDEDSKITIDRVGEETFKQIGRDITAIESIIKGQQDDDLCDEETNLTNKDILVLADRLVRDALEPAVGLLPDKRLPLVFTYFIDSQPQAKELLIRLVPYADVALIGIPPKSDLRFGHLLSIPHEVGHYIFWRGREVRKGSFIDQNSFDHENKMDAVRYGLVFNYQEEIFADVYSALTAGPLVALSSQFFQLKKRDGDFFKDDCDHPIPAIRPNIFVNVVERLKDEEESTELKVQYGSWANKLGSLWEKLSKDQWINNHRLVEVKYEKIEKFSEYIKPDSIPMDLDSLPIVELKVPIKYAVNEILAKIGDDINRYSSSNFWTQFLNKFKEDPRSNGLDPLPEILKADHPLFQAFVDAVTGLKGDTEPVMPHSSETLGRNDYEVIQAKWIDDWSLEPVWLRVYKADGWTTEGETNPWR